MSANLPTEQRAKIQLRPMSEQLPGGAVVMKPEVETKSPCNGPVLRLPEKRATRQVERDPFRTGGEGWAKENLEASSPPPPPVAKPAVVGGLRSSRRQGARRRWLWRAGFLLAAVAFAAGYKWSAKRTDEVRAEVSPEVLGMALRSMDDAVRAMYNGDYQGARLLAADARRAHPEISGSYLLEGEALLNDPASHQAVDRQAIVESAVGEGSYLGRVRLLQAEHLQRAGLEGEQAERVALGALDELLREGMREDIGAYEPRLKVGDLSALLPRSPAAQQAYLKALYRLDEWQSAMVISAKMQVAGDEVGRKLVWPNGEEFQTPRSLAGYALASLRRAVRAGADPVEALKDLQKLLPGSTYAKVLHDPSLRVSVPPPSLMVARRSLPSALPHLAAMNPERLE